MSIRRVYETTFIVNAALEDADIETVLTKVKGYIENHGGEVLEINKWGRRRLAYPINKKYNGFYIYVSFETMPSSVPVLERFLDLEDTVLRHLTLVLPDKLKEFRKERELSAGREEAAAAAEENAKAEEKKAADKNEVDA
jgi:small subunit ribosomal protein S6